MWGWYTVNSMCVLVDTNRKLAKVLRLLETVSIGSQRVRGECVKNSREITLKLTSVRNTAFVSEVTLQYEHCHQVVTCVNCNESK